ncbi:hypothetical protein VOLCADRAFT_121463 [Volvox carteri f. nagariensis]|uniref:Uncharacterized protein n=1 Tax=Volvox carteri f. nagariensis TaxID=3068 RepID=D8UAX3_VOLCA|nr:uncharacterized protein VOLCADRAFT_121463 [Volvox carteri f. nagariensis]EFJ43072.1 hypothetical protein VOLCADRAFT_121463 [Volvox carteri f. nagariensis]|eukprot:XP_002955871.1 hypothetical protein VOLCADRAFT_121463 [Volvox carteri f. nagariensis]
MVSCSFFPGTDVGNSALQQECGLRIASRGGFGSSWSMQHERQSTASLTSSTSSLAATAAWQASVANAESSQVEDWLAALHQVDAEARGLCSGLLARHPTLLWKDAQRTTGVVQALLDANRQRQLMRPYFMQDAHVLALVDRYTPESLRARLSELHRLVWQKLDDSNVAALFVSRTSLDMLDLDAKALALKAQALRALIPEFLPSTILRGCPELLDVQVDDLPTYVHRAGDVVVIGAQVGVELVGTNNVVVQLLHEHACAARGDSMEAREVVQVFCNSRQLVFAKGEQVEVRVEDPNKAQEDLSAACRMAVLQGLAIASQASAGVRCA